MKVFNSSSPHFNIREDIFLQCDESLIEKIPLAKERYVASIFTSMILNNEGVREWRVKAYKRG